MKFSYSRALLQLFVLLWMASACEKPETPTPLVPTVQMNLDSTLLANDSHFGTRLSIIVENAPEVTPEEVEWRVENPRIAEVTAEGIVWPRGAGITYVYGKVVSLGLEARCKVIVTDANDYKFRLVLKDKGQSNYTLGNPEAYLSPKAIERRRKMGIGIDPSDLPISPAYLQRITAVGGTIITKSKWLNTVCVNVQDQFLIDEYKKLPFVQEVILVYVGRRKESTSPPKYVDQPQLGSDRPLGSTIDYGAAKSNISTVGGQVLHEQGFRGAGIDIAVLDDGFLNMKTNPKLNTIRIKGAKSFVYENDDPYNAHSHGIWVTSCMATNQPGTYVGTAPEANYWLLRTEDSSSEYPIEEDYWASAAEFADSVGADIINSSLSYDAFYYPFTSYTETDMNGKTAVASRAANMAFQKGIFLVNSAGNERRWVGTPADSPSVLAVGSINQNRMLGHYTSWGTTADGRIKPDVLAMGDGASVIAVSGEVDIRSGTSFASPIMCGLVACLWQAYPNLSNQDLLEIIRNSADRGAKPEPPYGYGIANMENAMQLAKDKLASKAR